MKTRIITAGIGIVFAVLVLVFGEMNSIVVCIVISLLTALMCYELLSAKHLEKDLKFVLPSCLFALLNPFLSYSPLKYLPIFLYFVAVAIIFIRFHDKIDFNDIIFSIAGTLIITVSMSLFAFYACSENEHTAFKCVIVLVVPWLADSGAYFVGNAIGKKKLCPEISPKKTVEGAAGGLVTGALGALLTGFIFLLIYGYDNFHPNFLALAILGLVNAVVSILGDLFFSLIKRNTGIKDYGSILPGHGGMLDRFDSVFFCIPFAVFMSQFF